MRPELERNLGDDFLLRAEKIEHCADQAEQESCEQYILQDGKGPAWCPRRRRHVVELPGEDRREGKNHYT